MTFFRAASLLLLIPSFSHGFLLPSTATTAVTSASSSSSSPTSSSSSSPFPGSDGSSTTSLCSKNSDRARTERILEESMGDDWRHFRAKLVAQETVERGQQQQAAATTNNNGNNNTNNKKQKNKKTKRSMETPSSSSSSSDDEKQGQLGELFGSVISSIFSSSSSSSSSSSNEKGDDWDSIGVPPKDSKEQQQQQQVKEQQLLCADPFVSEAELPIHLKPQKGSFLNKHRWAHPISHIEQGCVLIATEKLGGTFHQSVVLVVEHHPKEGTTGLIINRPIDGTLDQVASSLTKDYSVGSSGGGSSDNKKNKLTSTNPKKEQEKEKATESKIDLSLKLAFRNSPVGFGGPIHQESFHILHGYGEVEGSTKLAPGVFIGGSEELMDQVRVGNFDPQKALFLKGHGEWVGGQLEQEIQKGVWYVASCASDFLLRHAGAPIQEEDNADDLWTDLLVCMGGEHSKVAQKGIGKGDKRKKMP